MRKRGRGKGEGRDENKDEGSLGREEGSGMKGKGTEEGMVEKLKGKGTARIKTSILFSVLPSIIIVSYLSSLKLINWN